MIVVANVAHQAERFDRAALPPAASFYRHEFDKLSRPSRGWARTRCIFHGGDNPTALSVNLEHGGFFCFNCGAKGGDVLDFVKLRDGVSFVEAARRLGALRDVPPDTSRRDRARAREAADRAWRDNYVTRVETLLDDMHVYESARDWAFVHHQDAITKDAESGMNFIGTRYLYAKLAMLQVER